ncbi:MAG TPA: prepilin-type N-terminal cleavage/methylation domain-containing protein [Verrucomicrobiae bacterium]
MIVFKAPAGKYHCGFPLRRLSALGFLKIVGPHGQYGRGCFFNGRWCGYMNHQLKSSLPRQLASSRKVQALTMLELLVVIAIVAVLAALMLPALFQAKAKGRQIHCVGNLHQQGIGLQIFVANNHAYPSFKGSTNSDNPGWWMNQISSGSFGVTKTAADLVKEGIWLCPTAPMHMAYPNEAVPFCSYGYNVWGVSVNSAKGFTNALGLCGAQLAGIPSLGGHPGFAPVEESQVRVPADMMAIGDSLPGGIRFDRYDMLAPPGTGRAMARHQGKVNVLFCDGHVESLPLKYVFEDTNDTALVRWNRDHQPHRDQL